MHNDIRQSNLQSLIPPSLFPQPPQRLPSPQQIPKVRTVEELERMLLNQAKPSNNNVQPNQQFQQSGQVGYGFIHS